MADNVNITPGAGDTIAADDVSGVKYQKLKIAVGSAGSANLVDSSHPFPVTVVNSAASSTATSPTQTAVNTSNAQLFAANSSRKKLIIQNTGKTEIKVSLGGTASTQTAYTVCLGACSDDNKGDGGSYVDTTWTGAVQVISSAAGGTLVGTELT